MLGDYDFKKVKFVQEISDYHELIDTIKQKGNDDKENQLTKIDQLAALFFYMLNLKSPSSDVVKSLDIDERLVSPSINPYWKIYYFKYLCRSLKFDCEIKAGYVRRIKDHFEHITNDDTNTNHFWNTVSLGSKSDKLICDLTWSSVNRPNDYFMVPNELSLPTHIPLDLMSEVSDYLHLPIITEKCRQIFVHEKSNNFHPINITAHKNTGKCSFVLKTRLNKYHNFWHNIYYCPLQSSNNDLSQEYRKYTLLEVNNDSVNLYWRLPKSGIYIITLFFSNSFKMDKSNAPKCDMNSKYDAIYSIRVECSKDNQAAYPFVGCNTINYGVCKSLLNRFKMSTVNFHKGVIKSGMRPPALLEVVFNKAVTPKVSTIIQVRGREDVLGKDQNTMKFHYFPSQKKLEPLKPSSDDISHEYTGVLVNNLIDDEDDLAEEITFTIRIPKSGEYAIEVLCSPTPNCPKSEYVSVAQYFIDMTIDNPLFT